MPLNPIAKHDLLILLRTLSYILTALIGYLAG